jgi:D-alanyl-D-alanine carboxypeptidase
MASGLPQIDAGALARSAVARPGVRARHRAAYNSLNYRIIGLLIEHPTRRSIADEITARVLNPLHLTGISVPEGAPGMPPPYLTLTS